MRDCHRSGEVKLFGELHPSTQCWGHNLVKLARNILGYSWVPKYRWNDPRAPALRAYPENTTQSEVFFKPRPWQLKRPLKDSLIVVAETSSHLPASAR